MELTQEFIDSLAPNGDAASNGKSLAKRGSFSNLSVSKEDDLLFGQCAGSGKNPYSCSVDFSDKSKAPVARCSCPSRQIPCKHALGLLYAYASGAQFTAADIPQDIQDKRNKAEKRQEAKARAKDETAEVKPPSKAQITSALKKIDAQLEGITMGDKLLQSIVNLGLAGIDAKTQAAYKEQVKQFGNYYIDGVQRAFNELFILLEAEKGNDYAKSIFQAQYIKALLKKGAEYLAGKKNVENGEIVMDTESAIEEQIGHAWKLEELRHYGKCKKDAELLQLGFYSYGDDARKEFVDEGYFISLNGGEIYTAKNYRPYKALKYVKEEDSLFSVIKTEELMVYPGNMNPRIRWDACSFREPVEGDYKHALSFAGPVYADVIKAVKNQIKNPLSDKNPLAFLLVSGVELLKKEDEELLVIRDKNNAAQILSDAGHVDVKTLPHLKRYAAALRGTGLLVMYHNDVATGRLCAKPLSVVTEKSVIRLAY
ncbi:MAG: SWIM zinc finger domain-containing protein [Treponema sp.]|jgi:uncharacterized Zn finger protein|nr:SWIM zinc finger domain-containing protein [Treponema sp.]